MLMQNTTQVILTKAVDTLSRHLHTHQLAKPESSTSHAVEEAKECISKLSKLKYDMQRDRTLPLVEDDLVDAANWNWLIERADTFWEGTGKTWFSAPWLFVECSMYRKIHESFASTTQWKDYDVFAEQQKEPAFYGSVQSVVELTKHLADVESAHLNTNETRVALRELIQFSLWGNQTDLSLLVNVSHSDMHKMQTSSASHLEESEKHIIVNDIDIVLDRLGKIRSGRVDIVLDNAGFELIADLCLADFLIHSGIADVIILHAKQMPWFVSDTTPRDLQWTIDETAKKAEELDDGLLKERVKRWRKLLAEKKWVVKVDPFWTLPYAFWNLPTAAAELYRDLGMADLVIFKGDLNYRKLVYDAEWPTSTPFVTAIGPLAKDQTPPFVALRTCKSDVAVGLKEGQDKELFKADSDWMISGKYGTRSDTRGPPDSENEKKSEN
ncbi:hypothetical protein HK104_006897 [Borealophlyctis nickersoniae]|nr:hypothetical protein HK104_006897 [Borealophlyctis nickersoniae]